MKKFLNIVLDILAGTTMAFVLPGGMIWSLARFSVETFFLSLGILIMTIAYFRELKSNS